MNTSTQGLTTSQAIDMGIRDAEIYHREIAHGVARAIADTFHDGSRVALAFVSTGYVPAESGDLYRILVPEYHRLSAQERRWADWLGTYLVHRKDRETPVAGWADLWADTPVVSCTCDGDGESHREWCEPSFPR